MASRNSGGNEPMRSKKIINLDEDEDGAPVAGPSSASKGNAPARPKPQSSNPSGRRDARLPVIQHLSDQWTQRLAEAKLAENQTTEICHDLEGSPIRGESFRRLLTAGLWLDGDIVNAYLDMVGRWANQEAGESRVPKFVVHNTFFFDLMERPFGTESSKPSSNDAQALVKRMEKAGVVRDDILRVDTVLIPINHKGDHWVLGTVRPLRRQVELWDSLGGIQGHWSKNDTWRVDCNIFLRWLKVQCGTGSGVDTKQWKFNPCSGPKQDNGYDCGMYVCTTAHCLALNIHPVFRAEDMQQQRRNIAATILNKGFTGEFRWAEQGL